MPTLTASNSSRLPLPLFNESTLDEYREFTQYAVDAVRDAAAAADQPVRTAPVQALRSAAHQTDLDQPLGSIQAALEETKSLYLDHAVWFHHPSYLAHLNCPVALTAIAADVIASSVNTSVDTWDQSLGATHLELRLMHWLTGKFGLGSLADGSFTSGGTQSNLQALFTARQMALLDGAALGDLRILASAEAHFSVLKAATVLGLGESSVLAIDTDARGRIDPAAAQEQISMVRASGLVPMALVATAGTTDRGVIDPLPELGALCRSSRVWFHVDAAVGGALITSTQNSHLVEGISQADSITVDFHKTWYQPVACSAVLMRDGGALRHAGLHADYLNPATATAPNQVDKSLATSRRFDALKLWLTLRTHGACAIGDTLDVCLGNAHLAYRLAAQTERVEAFEDPATFMLLFRYTGGRTEAENDAINDAIRRELFAGGQTVIARTRHSGRTWLKLTLLNPATQEQHLQAALADVVSCGDRLATHGADTERLEASA